MPARLVVTKKADKNFLKLPRSIQDKVISAYLFLSQNPIMGVKLHGELSEYYKYRVGDYRIIYRLRIREKILEVVKIEHRQGVYK